ncbi:aspartate-semialdehyde dehydrogenase [Candidatus Carsonella ruddii HT isolate Thao2000]|uniref:aspartate-semialdehyde dehydrogenase n=1 Tax=Candidatus Carsonella ruddii HT isolate Thao2000 TaxID=1202539 RepID=J3Z1I6_CARRU|nr:aspartate-semialdehyde dehydrogenase [Candidatus Carsonella ruddii]AFP84129.1 aspartate-semialdehyde dehydrogenase [Candidatus Carsonella ruddii HT isolate Thao2000]
MIKIGIIGWRGLVGSVLLNRLKNSFINKYSIFFYFSTNKIFFNYNIYNAFDIKLLCNMDIIICCQGSEYTKIILKKILLLNWKGYWIDSSSYLRMYKECELILDPINKKNILNNLKKKKIFSGVNCTVSLMLILFKELFKIDVIEWIASSSYQAISGAGSYLVNKILKNIKSSNNLENNLIKIEKSNKINFFNNDPLLFNAIPWIDKKVNFSQTKEEWKSQSEANKLLNKNIKIDSNCVRISSLRCHSQYFIVKFKKKLNLNNLYYLLNNKYIKIVKNNSFNTNNILTPYNISGNLKIFVGRIKKSTFNNNVYTMFSIGDQLLWGAAEPLKRFLEILVQNLI